MPVVCSVLVSFIILNILPPALSFGLFIRLSAQQLGLLRQLLCPLSTIFKEEIATTPVLEKTLRVSWPQLSASMPHQQVFPLILLQIFTLWLLEVFAVRRVFWAESDRKWSDPLRSDQIPLRIFSTPNGRDRANFFEQILIRNTESEQIWADLILTRFQACFWAESDQN